MARTIKGMLDISIENVKKVIVTDEQKEEFMRGTYAVSEKYDGVKITLVRNGEDFNPDDFSKNFIVSYKRAVIHQEDFVGVNREIAKVHSIGDAQFCFIFDHFKKIHRELGEIPKNTEFFIEYIVQKPTVTRDYKKRHQMFLIAVSHDISYIESKGILTTWPEKVSYNVEEFASLLGIKTPRKLENFSTPLAVAKDFESYCQKVLSVKSSEGGKIEGVVITDGKRALKILQDDQHDKEVRWKKKMRYQMEDESHYFLRLKAIAEDFLATLNLEESIPNLLTQLSAEAYSHEKFPFHSKKNRFQQSEDFYHVLKYLMLKKLPGNNGALFIGRMQPPTKLHAQIIEEGLKNYDYVVVAVVKGKKSDPEKNPFPFELQERILREMFGEIEVVEVSTGNLISAFNSIPYNINAVLCGSDRAFSYKNQLFYNPEIKVVSLDRDLSPVSGTILRNSIKQGKLAEFKKNSHRAAHKFYEELKKYL